MDEILVLGALVLIAIPVALIYLLVSHSALKRRFNELERQFRAEAFTPEPEVQPVAPLAATAKPAEKPVAQKSTAPWSKGGKVEAPPTPPAAEPDQAVPPRAVVLRREKMRALSLWLRENWFYAVSAVSLALAGIFLVQYGMESGFLPPVIRVVAALGFGGALVGAGEWIRRRYGDDESSSTAYLPSTFSGAGIVTLFAGILSARMLYGLIGSEVALIGMFGVAVVAIVLGWFYGPFLAAVGIIGAMGAPFVVGGSSDDPGWLFGYFGLIVLVGLFVDARRRWAWISMISLVLGYGAGTLVYWGSPGVDAGFIIYAVVLAIAAIAVPVLRIMPNHSGAMVSGFLSNPKGGWPEFPTRLAGGAVLASSLALVLVAATYEDVAQFWLMFMGLAGLTFALMIWCRNAPALQDLTVLPASGLLAAVAFEAHFVGPIYEQFAAGIHANPEADMQMGATLLLGMAMLVSVVAAWRSLGETQYRVVWAAFAALFAPAMAITLDLLWHPAAVIGEYPWALHASALAALMTGMAVRFARVDNDDRLRTAFATLSALASIAFAFVIILSSAALTVALALTVVAAAALDRRFDLRPMGWFITVGVVTLGFRLTVDPGLAWAENAPIAELFLAYGGTLAAFIAGLWLLRARDRPAPKVMLDSAAWATGGMLASLLLFRWIKATSGWSGVESHWSLALIAIIWMGVAFAQLQRRDIGGRLAQLRTALAVVFGLMSFGLMLVAATVLNPAVNSGEIVLGVAVFNTLAVAYLLPALVLAVALWRLPDMHKNLRIALWAMVLALGALWLGLTIRHFWQGASGMAGNTVTQAELYSYTVVLLILGAGLFYQSLTRRNDAMRKAGLAVIGLAVAKVFFIDISGLGGLTRVFSLLALGLSLAGLAWLNRWAQSRFEGESGVPPKPEESPASEPDGDT